MSGAVTAAVVTAAATVGASVYSADKQRSASNKQRRAQEEAARKSEQQANRQIEQQEQQVQRNQNRTRASADAAIDGGTNASLDGPGSTLLTGAQGISPDQLQLGKNSLLGG